jgi:hypothetical protein
MAEKSKIKTSALGRASLLCPHITEAGQARMERKPASYRVLQEDSSKRTLILSVL